MATREVTCYHCSRGFGVAARAITLTCPGCYRRVALDDVVVADERRTRHIETCGVLLVQRRGVLRAQTVRAGAGIVVEGVLEAEVVISGARVIIAPGGRWRGGLTAPALVVEAGGVVESGSFRIGAGASPVGGTASKSVGVGAPPEADGAPAPSLMLSGVGVHAGGRTLRGAGTLTPARASVAATLGPASGWRRRA